ncbi:AI-2E family transporter [Sphingosinicella sp. LHD-64]|uniref:AI-2E family transporter n=1 Tax=Sphingosinicella sp. LHD-64 TaxID=3072139 RepID=UPI00280F8D6A|nr:AI-2E family transporter [Sphingosinicella sp. LHD-64]MDQ8755698.1 AI-2E family transporter [Sphingosinicella sp. LHD-64]
MADPPPQPVRPRPIIPVTGLVLAAGTAVVALWFLYQISGAILLLFFAAVVGIALSAPVQWFKRRGLSHRMAGTVTLLLFFGTILLLGWLVIPRLIAQIVSLVNGLPRFIVQIENQVAELLSNYPDLQHFVRLGGAGGDFAATAVNLFAGVGAASLSLLGFIALMLIFFSTIAYIVLDPKPIVQGYIGSLPYEHRAAGVRAYRRAARSVIGWARASLVVGALQAIAVFVFLTLMEVPGALVWAALAFFADFIPRIGGYVMAFPPVVLALGQSPMTAVWIAVFYAVSNEILGSVVAPKIRGATMQLHPVLIIFFTLAFALAFGLLGAIVAVPAAAFASAYYSEFYMKRPPAR